MLLYSYYIYTLIIFSWIVFDGCILNDIEAKYAKNGENTGSLTLRLTSMMGFDVNKHGKYVKKFNDIYLLCSYLLFAYKSKHLNQGLLFLTIYITLNKGIDGRGWKLSK